MTSTKAPLCLAFLLSGAAGCAGQAEVSSSDALAGTQATSAGPSGAGNSAGQVVPAPAPQSPGGTPTSLPPEVELSLDFELPHAGRRYVYAANPKSDTVAVIDASTLAITSVEAGDQPTFLQTLAGADAVVVLNVGSSDASIIRTSGGESTSTTVPVQEGANAIAVSGDGAHAVVYFDARHRGAGVTGSYQDISVLFLERGDEAAVAMTVGFRPSSVSFTDDGERAFVVTEDGVSILDFAEILAKGAHIARTLPLGDAAATSLDVTVTPDGAYALARREGESELRLLDLDSGDLQLLELANLIASPVPPPEPEAQPEPQPEPGPVAFPDAGVDAGTDSRPDAGADAGVNGLADAGVVEPIPALLATVAPPPPAPAAAAAVTDVDLAPSGEFALAVVRDLSTVLRVPIPGGFTQPETVTTTFVEGELIGSVDVSTDSRRALLYTTVVEANERISILDIEDGSFDVVRLAKSVERVTITPDGDKALIVHRKLPGNPDEAGIDPDTVIDRSYGYSVVDFDSGFSKLQTARSPVGPATVVPTGSDLFVLFNDPSVGLFEVHQVGLESFLVERITLGSPPNSIGSVPDSQRVFVGQEHPDGRISFIDWETGELESVTGFELNSRIRE
jgi:YVTN family beta-propeller protein